ncbi:MAG: AbrB family transcriptional regulator [Acidobacteria bacterium]|nr:MAG: AbrB family transcriptional regulator [Acidobacteriota bacterium]
MKLRLDKLGRIVLPKPLRLRYGLRPGMELEVNEGAQEIVLRPARSSPTMVNDRGVWIHQGTPVSEVDFDNAIREDREDRLKRIGGME